MNTQISQSDFEAYAAQRNLWSARLACVLIAILMPVGVILDYVTYPEFVVTFIGLRVTGLVVGLTALAIAHAPRAERWAFWLGAIPALLAAVLIEMMIHSLEGGASPYYAGLSLIILGAGFIFTWTASETLFFCGSILLIWVVPSLTDSRPIEVGPFFNNLYFLTLTSVVAVASNASRYALARREFEAKTRLAHTTGELRKALEQLRDLDQAKMRFFTNISHELRTPLTLILAPLEGLLGRQNRPRAERLELERMHRNGLRLLKHINDLLDLSRLDANREKLRLQETDLQAHLEGLLNSCRGLADKRGIQLEFRALESVPPFPVDCQRVEQIFLNLLSNALRFATASRSKQPRVIVRCGIREDRYFFEVEDTGPGIPEHQIDQIFERFQRADSPLAPDHGGTGIGLALVKELTELHMGAVGVTSILGEGSTFSVEVPMNTDVYPPERLSRRQRDVPVPLDRRSEADLARLREVLCDPASLDLSDFGARTAGEGASAPGPLVLTVDDNKDMLAYVSTLLSREYRVIAAEDGEQAFRMALQNLPDVVIADVMMPRRSGQELLHDLREEPRTRDIPVILVTAKAEAEAKVMGLDAGADDYLSKPFNSRELRARVRSLVQRRQLQAELREQNERLTSINFDLLLAQKEVFLQTIQALGCVVEAKDPYTHGHSRRVSVMAEALSTTMGLDEAECERVRLAAALHDIGKIKVPELILNKPGRLEPEERAVVELHPVVGDRILESVQALADVRMVILHHHEKFDGTGYPARLSGRRIPRAARVIAVADTYDAMTSDRSYRKGLSHEAAIAEIGRHAGTQFDPDVASTFLEIFGDAAPTIPSVPSHFSSIKAAL